MSGLPLWGLPPDWSSRGHEIDGIISLVHWVMLALAIFWLGYFLFTLWRFRAGSTASRRPPRGRWALVLAGAALLQQGAVANEPTLGFPPVMMEVYELSQQDGEGLGYVPVLQRGTRAGSTAARDAVGANEDPSLRPR